MSIDCHAITHSRTFVDQWKELLKAVYNYKFERGFAVVPSIFGGKCYSYLPFQDFTDLESSEADQRIGEVQDKRYQIRSLNFAYKNFKAGDPVNMRLEIAGMSSEDILKQRVHRSCRNKISQSMRRSSLETRSGSNESLINDFHSIFAKVMHKHGTPVNTKRLFLYLPRFFGNDVFYQVHYLNNHPAGASIVLFDGKLAQLYWNVIDYDFAYTQIGYFSFWKSIEQAVENREIDVFDFGRSCFGGTTYDFKCQWGSVPVKIDIKRNRVEDIYSKYETASVIWKRSPRWAADFLGPRLCKYLADL